MLFGLFRVLPNLYRVEALAYVDPVTCCHLRLAPCVPACPLLYSQTLCCFSKITGQYQRVVVTHLVLCGNFHYLLKMTDANEPHRRFLFKHRKERGEGRERKRELLP